MSQVPDFSLSLEENAVDSLAHAVHHFVDDDNPTYLKYAILHSFHAVELFMKSRLAKEHPVLIYRDINRTVSDDSVTVGFDELEGRLRNVGVTFNSDDLTHLKQLRKVRNAIEHSRFAANNATVVDYVGRAMHFLDSFVADELGIDLADRLDPRVYAKLEESKSGFELALKHAERAMGQFINQDTEILECPECGNQTVIYPDPRREDGLVECFTPGCAATFRIGICYKCGGVMLRPDRDQDDDVDFHDYCWDYMMRE